jgi:hypothetical protein
VNVFLRVQGNGKKLVNGGSTSFSPRSENQISVQFAFGSWFHESEDFNWAAFRSVRASRKEIMAVLANLEYILIKLVRLLFDLVSCWIASSKSVFCFPSLRTQWTSNRQIDVTFSEFKFDSATTTNVGFGQTEYVESCRCPAGYSGLSCEVSPRVQLFFSIYSFFICGRTFK